MITVVGADGRLGSEFRRLLPDARMVTRTDVDLEDIDRIAEVLSDGPEGPIINCAAYNLVDDAEDHPDTANAVNCAAVGTMARFARDSGVPFVTYSTDYVFDGESPSPYTEESARNPINAYGLSKACGEDAALASGALVIRTAWLFSGSPTDFVGRMIAAAGDGPVSVVADQTGSPTYTEDLAKRTLSVLDRGVTGLLHVVNSGAATRYELAVAAVEAAGIPASLVEPVSSDRFPTRARRPRHSVLATQRHQELGGELPAWRDAVVRAVARLGA